MLFTRSVQTLHRVTNRLLAVEVARQLTVTALALKRYALKHGTYPPDLAALVPEFIDSVPLDPVDRRPLRYHVDPDGGFSLYSIGEDGQDNGGDASSAADSKSLSRIDAETRGESWHNGRDQVWPRPATPEQVEAHFKKLTDKRKR